MAEIAEAVQNATPHQPIDSRQIRGPISKFSEVLDTVRVSSTDALESTADFPTECACYRLLEPCRLTPQDSWRSEARP
jgi:hypothetical protein